MLLATSLSWSSAAESEEESPVAAKQVGSSVVLDWEVSMSGLGSTAGNLPFWAVTNRRGLLPLSVPGYPDWASGFSSEGISGKGAAVSAGGLVTAGTSVSFRSESGLGIEAGISVAGNAGGLSCNLFADRLYAGISWRHIHLDLGMRDRPRDFRGLSLTGGNVVYTGNARNLPGYSLYTDYIWFPGRRKVVAFKASFGDYLMADNRYVSYTRVHNQSLSMKFRVHRTVDLTFGIETWSQWGGVSPVYGPQPGSFHDYLRILTYSKGGSNALATDQENALGNNVGRELIRVDWRSGAGTLVFQHDIPFDDGSGAGFQNFPDGVNTLSFAFSDRKGWVTDLLYEFVYTKCQSGPYHSRPAHDDELAKNPDKPFYTVGGADNYFNNSIYRSGWTYFGRTVGLPLFVTRFPDSDGKVLGVSSNKVVAHHFGIGGMVAHKVPYRFLFTWSRHSGTPSGSAAESWRFSGNPSQFSMALEYELPAFRPWHIQVPFSLGLGIYADSGDVFPHSFGAIVRISFSGRMAWSGSFARVR